MDELDESGWKALRQARAMELKSRGEDCLKYVDAYRAKEEKEAREKADFQRTLDRWAEERKVKEMQRLNPTLTCTATGPYEMRTVTCR